MDKHLRHAGVLLACAVTAASAVEPTGRAVEFFNAATTRYFITADSDEMAALESGAAGPGWRRTGGEFGVFKSSADAADASPVCRFYARGPNSHFFTADPEECELLKQANGGWRYEGVAFHVALPVAGQCAAGTTPVYRSYNLGAARNDSSHRFTVDATVYAKSVSYGYPAREGIVMCAPLSRADLEADAARLLQQATFGPTDDQISRIAASGPAAWIDEQLSMPATRYPAYAWVPATRSADCVDNSAPPITATSFCERDNYSVAPLQLEFFRNALYQPDQLRGRVAFALSQILVTSGLTNAPNYAMRNYQQALVDQAFGNFHDALLGVTLSPHMGEYLNMANNSKADALAGVKPNENYAREILQLFSVGTVLLEADGTLSSDADGKPIPAYGQEEIASFARVFTGWTYPPAPATASNPRDYASPMVPVAANHDFGAKRLLASVDAAGGMSVEEDLEFAHRTILNHRNIAPFLARQLIQKLVTSDPTPEYVRRVARAWADDGRGQRGNLSAVTRAVLLDPEARGARKIDAGYGKLREPVLFLTAVARAANATSDGVYLRNQSTSLGQNVFNSPSVFNYYSPGYGIPGTQLIGPEFELLTATNALARLSIVNSLVMGDGIAPSPNIFGATGTRLDVSPYASVAADSGALVARIDRNIMAGSMSAYARAAITGAVEAVPANDATMRARTALYLAFSSSQYQVQR